MSEPSHVAEAPNLRALVAHGDFVRAGETLEAVQQRFAAGHHDFMAVLDGRTLVGLCSRRDLGSLLGSRYGFALHARAVVSNHLTPEAVRIRVDDRLTDVLQSVSTRPNEHFYDDVLLVDAAGDYLGLIPVRELVRLQTGLLLGNLAELATKNRQMEDDLRMAREVQVAMLPGEFPDCRAADGTVLRFAHLYEPSGGVSGDFFDVLPVSAQAAGLIICDVMGHGVRSALITAMVRAMLEELRPLAADPGALMTKMNAQLTHLLRRTGDTIFVTAAYAVVDASARQIAYAQAGHPTAILLEHCAGAAAPLREAARAGGPALGLIEDHVYEVTILPFRAGDRLMLYTDGISEAADASGEEFGTSRLAAAFAQEAGRPLAEQLAAVKAAAAGFSGGSTFSDDVCLLGCELAPAGLG